MVSLCLNMIVKNESHVIKKTLERLCEVFPLTYWVISDTGSTDDTKEVIKNSFPNTFNIMVPRIEDELSLRWLEYQKYKSRPEKIKHLLFIQKHNIPYNTFILE